jgi:hypothetical protein
MRRNLSGGGKYIGKYNRFPPRSGSSSSLKNSANTNYIAVSTQMTFIQTISIVSTQNFVGCKGF